MSEYYDLIKTILPLFTEYALSENNSVMRDMFVEYVFITDSSSARRSSLKNKNK